MLVHELIGLLEILLHLVLNHVGNGLVLYGSLDDLSHVWETLSPYDLDSLVEPLMLNNSLSLFCHLNHLVQDYLQGPADVIQIWGKVQSLHSEHYLGVEESCIGLPLIILDLVLQGQHALVSGLHQSAYRHIIGQTDERSDPLFVVLGEVQEIPPLLLL